MMFHSLDNILCVVQTIIDNEYGIQKLKSPVGFPYSEIYYEQVEPVRVIQSLNPGESCLLCSHTGSGKTAVFLSATRGISTLIIEPRKALQAQVNRDYNKVETNVIKGRANYHCLYAKDASLAPCKKTYERKIGGEKVRVFKVFISETKYKEVEYPCGGCEYFSAKNAAKYALSSNGIVICNSYNFMNYINLADLVILDEADLTCKDVSSSVILKYITELSETVVETLEEELSLAKKDCEEISENIERADTKMNQDFWIKKHTNLENHIRKIKDFYKNHDICYQYTKKSTKKLKNDEFKIQNYIEIVPDNIIHVVDRKFNPIQKIDIDGASYIKKRRVIFVTATPGDFPNSNIISYAVPQRAGIFYTPIDKMTQHNLKNQMNSDNVYVINGNKIPEAIIKCGNFIKQIHDLFETRVLLDNGYNSSKCIIHIGNFEYGANLSHVIGTEICELHQSGELEQTLERFEANDKEYLLVASADYGGDFKTISHQFILKLPYATLDERLQSFKKLRGERLFDEWFTKDALTRLIQQSGRVGRGANGVGFTFILDSKFGEVYDKYKKSGIVPQWFEQRIERVEQMLREAAFK